MANVSQEQNALREMIAAFRVSELQLLLGKIFYYITFYQLNFRYSVKATKICPIFHLFDITYYVMSKAEWKIGQNLIDALLLN